MTTRRPGFEDGQRRARNRSILIFAGFVDMAIAGFFLGWGHSLLGLEHRVAWLIAAVLAAAAVSTFFIATLAYGRRGQRRALDEGEDDGPVVRR